MIGHGFDLERGATELAFERRRLAFPRRQWIVPGLSELIPLGPANAHLRLTELMPANLIALHHG
jgi:hypothetical protein